MNQTKLFIIPRDITNKYHDFLFNKLSETQKKKYDCYKHDKNKAFYLLSSYIKNEMGEKNITYNANHKPYLVNGPFFNISHSGNYLILAISDTEIGVDIEINKKRDFNAIKKIFNEEEINYIKSDIDFYRLWCAKESLIKCFGGSLSAIKDVPSLPLNGIKQYQKNNYYSHSFIYDNHIICLALKSSSPVFIDNQVINQLPFLLF